MNSSEEHFLKIREFSKGLDVILNQVLGDLPTKEILKILRDKIKSIIGEELNKIEERRLRETDSDIISISATFNIKTINIREVEMQFEDRINILKDYLIEKKCHEFRDRKVTVEID